MNNTPLRRKRTVVLTFDDACRSHIEIVAPILKQYGFGATFFICRFDDEWRAKHEKHLLTAPEIRRLADSGFEIGNHTWNHPSLQQRSASECNTEIVRLNQFLQDAGVPPPVSFAYPGGPYAANAAPLLAASFRGARTTEQRPWHPKADDPMRIPAIPIQGEDKQRFYQAVEQTRHDNTVVLVFHGVPDPVHEWVNTPPHLFAEYMQYLHQNGFRAASMREILFEHGLNHPESDQ